MPNKNEKKPLDLKTAQRILMFNFVFMLFWVLLLVVLYETELVLPGSMADDANIQFVALSLLELLTIAAVPLALKLFSIKAVRRRLIAGKASSLLPWGTFRMALICIPMWLNTFLYYQTLFAAFGYMAIILFLSSFFIVPTLGRCIVETEDLEEK